MNPDTKKSCHLEERNRLRLSSILQSSRLPESSLSEKVTGTFIPSDGWLLFKWMKYGVSGSSSTLSERVNLNVCSVLLNAGEFGFTNVARTLESGLLPEAFRRVAVRLLIVAEEEENLFILSSRAERT